MCLWSSAVVQLLVALSVLWLEVLDAFDAGGAGAGCCARSGIASGTASASAPSARRMERERSAPPSENEAMR